MEIYIVRHGQTEWNKEKRLQGSTDISLTKRAIEIAVESGITLRDTPFDLIYTSPLSRAKVTAEGFRGGRDIPLIVDTRLREVSFGSFEGHTLEELLKIDPDCSFQYFFSDPEKYKAPSDGESLEKLIERATAFMKEEIEPLADNPNIKRIMLVAHGAMNKALMCYVKNHGVKDFWSGGLQRNCNVIILDYQDKNYTVVDENRIFYKPSQKES